MENRIKSFQEHMELQRHNDRTFHRTDAAIPYDIVRAYVAHLRAGRVFGDRIPLSIYGEIITLPLKRRPPNSHSPDASDGPRVLSPERATNSSVRGHAPRTLNNHKDNFTLMWSALGKDTVDITAVSGYLAHTSYSAATKKAYTWAIVTDIRKHFIMSHFDDDAIDIGTLERLGGTTTRSPCFMERRRERRNFPAT